MKRGFMIWMAAVLLFAAAGCTGTENKGGASSVNNRSDVSQNTDNQGSEGNDGSSGRADPETPGKTLVVYFSATGTTERIAGSIAAATHADIFVLEPEEAYTADDLDWNDEKSRVSTEHSHPESRDVKLKTVKPPAFESYSTVLIGYPIWWGMAAFPVETFVKGNDFTGKTVIPFCTASSSDIGESGKQLSELAGTGEWREGKRFYSRSSEEDVREWLESFQIDWGDA